MSITIFELQQTFQPLNHSNLECLIISPRKPGELESQTWRFLFFGSCGSKVPASDWDSVSWSMSIRRWVAILSFLLSLLYHIIQRFIEIGVRIGPRFPPKLDLIQFVHYEDGFLEITRFLPEFSRFSDSLWDLEAKSWDRVLTAQTVRAGSSATVSQKLESNLMVLLQWWKVCW